MHIPEDLVQSFAHGDGTLFVGAGLSIGVGLPSWQELMSRIACEIQDCPTNASYQDIAQYYVNEYGIAKLTQRLRRELIPCSLTLQRYTTICLDCQLILSSPRTSMI